MPHRTGGPAEWVPAPLRLHPLRVLVGWAAATVALLIAAAVLPGLQVGGLLGGVLAAAAIGVLNAVLPPLIALVRLPFALAAGFVLMLVLDALMIRAVSELVAGALTVSGLPTALAAALIVSATSVVFAVVFGTDDDDTYTLRVTRRLAERAGDARRTDVPGVLFLEVDGLSLPTLRRAMRDGSAPHLASLLAGGTHRLVEWETDLSSQTGASQAGLLHGRNDEVAAFRWFERGPGRVMSCSSPGDLADVERRLSTGRGLLAGGGASRGNLFSGDAEDVLLTVSRIDAERGANRGYRPFFANGFNVTRVLVLVAWEVLLEVVAALRARRRDVRPRGRRGGTYPLVRAAVTVVVRDIVTYAVLADMMRGRPAVYATFAGYDEVAHHSGVERADTLEVLRKIDKQFARIDRAREHAPRPYHLVVLSDHGQTQGATFRQRNGHGLEELVERALADGPVARGGSGDENEVAPRRAFEEATGRPAEAPPRPDAEGRPAVVLASGNLGLVYLAGATARMSREQIDARHPALLPALRGHRHIGWVLVRSAHDGPVVLGPRGWRRLGDGAGDGDDPLAPFGPNARAHLRRADGLPHAPDVLVGGFYDPDLDEGCAFEELIAFHGGIGGNQSRAFLLHPAALAPPGEPLVGAEAVHAVLAGWRPPA
ncbi:MAG TPA: phage holin family protein [Miltoncostaeaceae bacterium]|nr:phage holin family protein [Miltoncostaeaceae bacterium]